MIEGSLPPTTIYSTWSECVEIWSIDDDTLMDLTSVTEITLKVRDPRSQFDEMTLTLSGGDITIPSQGIVQWRVEASQMSHLDTKLYEVIMLLENGTDTLPLFLGHVPIVQ